MEATAETPDPKISARPRVRAQLNEPLLRRAITKDPGARIPRRRLGDVRLDALVAAVVHDADRRRGRAVAEIRCAGPEFDSARDVARRRALGMREARKVPTTPGGVSARKTPAPDRAARRVPGGGSRPRRGVPRGYSVGAGRGTAAGCRADIPWGRVAAPPRVPRGYAAGVAFGISRDVMSTRR